jgi:hypothetical protein
MYLHSLMSPEFIVCSIISLISSPYITIIEFIIEMSLWLYDLLNAFFQILHDPHYWPATNRPPPSIMCVMFQFSLGLLPHIFIWFCTASKVIFFTGRYFLCKSCQFHYSCLSGNIEKYI